MTRAVRFADVAPITSDLPTWHDRLADSGYSTILMPDVPQWQPAPGPTLAVAATITGQGGRPLGVNSADRFVRSA